MKKILIGCWCIIALSQVSYAGSMSEEAQIYCEKIKTCAKQQMQQDMTEGLEAMMQQALDAMCVGAMQKAEQASEYKELHQSAAACFKSKSKQSCDQLGVDTAECLVFEEHVKEFNQ